MLPAKKHSPFFQICTRKSSKCNPNNFFTLSRVDVSTTYYASHLSLRSLDQEFCPHLAALFHHPTRFAHVRRAGNCLLVASIRPRILDCKMHPYSPRKQHPLSFAIDWNKHKVRERNCTIRNLKNVRDTRNRKKICGKYAHNYIYSCVNLRAPMLRANFETLKSVYPLSHCGSLSDCSTNRLTPLIPPFVAKRCDWLTALSIITPLLAVFWLTKFCCWGNCFLISRFFSLRVRKNMSKFATLNAPYFLKLYLSRYSSIWKYV